MSCVSETSPLHSVIVAQYRIQSGLSSVLGFVMSTFWPLMPVEIERSGVIR